jgi:ABC-2 type transport system ATP-binding protein
MADMRALLVDVAAGGQTVLLSSHLLAEVQEICDRVGIISGGRLLVESTVAELRGATGIRLVAEPIDRALAVAMSVAGDDAVEVDGPVLRVSGSAAQGARAGPRAGRRRRRHHRAHPGRALARGRLLRPDPYRH